VRIRKFRIRAFKCIGDTGEVEIRDIATLVGVNESGKTAVLDALAHLNKDNPITFVDINDELQDSVNKDDVIVEGQFLLDQTEIASIKSIGEFVPTISKVTIKKKYNPEKTDADNTEYGFDLIPDRVYRVNGEGWKQFTTNVSALFGKAGTVPDSVAKLLDRQPQNPDDFASTVHEIEEMMKLIGVEDSIASGWLGLKNSSTVVEEIELTSLVRAYIQKNLHPRLVYFSDYKKIMGGIDLTTYLKGETPKEQLDTGVQLDKLETINNLFRLAKISKEDLQSGIKDSALLSKHLAAAGGRITELMRKHWNSNIEVEFFPGSNNTLWIRIANITDDGRRTNIGYLNRRSEGLKWSFSFIINFLAETQGAELGQAILLLDEPGLHLHPAQQEYILNIMRDLSNTNQIIYTTHSPFMILNYSIGSIFLVETDPGTHRTKLEPQYWKGDLVSAVPILNRLGGRLYENLREATVTRTGRPVLVVEGPTDYKYLIAIEQFLLRKEPKVVKDFLPMNANPIPAGGAQSVPPLVMFHLTRNFNVLAFFNREPRSLELTDELKKLGVDENRIIYVQTREDADAEADIEDTFTQSDYLGAVNEYYKSKLKDARFVPIRKQDLASRINVSKRMVTALEGMWKEHPEWGSFDKNSVCDFICEKLSEDDMRFFTGKTQENFKSLFQEISNRVGMLSTSSKSTTEEQESPN